MQPNIIKELRKQAAEQWLKHFNMCEERKVWSALNASLLDIQTLELSWKLRWIEDQLDKLVEQK